MAFGETSKILQYKEHFKKEAEELLLTGFPAKILELNNLIENPQFQRRNFSEMHENSTFSLSNSSSDVSLDRGDPSEKLPNSILKSNQYVIDLIESVKPHMIKLLEDVKKLKMWIAYMIPRREDGNNFGVEIQEETLFLVHEIEKCVNAFYERIFAYFNTRGKVVKNFYNYSFVNDFKKAVCELDEKEYLSFSLAMSDIRDHYCGLHDIFLKNFEKLKQPKPHNCTESLY